jgi:murein DD-endopeptidase MepM/ murein hydrolase activator NlpD
MKRWTVMLIPHGQGSTRNLNLYSLQIWAVIGVFASLSFLAAFSFQRSSVAQADIERLELEKRELGLAATAEPVPVDSGLSDGERAAIEQQMRDEYEARLATITSQLSELYDLEARFRTINGLPPKSNQPAGFVGTTENTGTGGGKGGAPSMDPDTEMDAGDDVLMRPPSVINGVYRPGADLIVQEINLRAESLREYASASDARKDAIERMPSAWPVRGRKGIVTSRFGHRKDPFTRDLSFHDGFDISAPYGSPIVATAHGKVVFSGWDKYLGNCVRVDHGNGLTSVYGHMQKCTVSDGDTVSRGDQIGKLGSTGRSTGAHVHYEVRKNGKALDPAKYLGY